MVHPEVSDVKRRRRRRRRTNAETLPSFLTFLTHHAEEPRDWIGLLDESHHLLPNHQRWCAKRKLSRNTYTLHTRFCEFGHGFVMPGRCLYKQKLLHRSSVGSLLRVRCWLGTQQESAEFFSQLGTQKIAN